MLTAIISLTGLALVFGLLLGFASKIFAVEEDPVVDKIDAILPQTQCGQCGFGGCRPYAEAIANNKANINQCPPGGEATIMQLSDLLGVDPLPLNEEHGQHQEKRVAIIDEQTCIGCTRCIQVCPVDAILGTAKHMHTVITEECTGCDLCVPACPIENCILMIPVQSDIYNWKWKAPNDAR